MAMVDTVYWLPIGGPAAQVVWLGQRSAATWRPFCIHHAREPSELSQWLYYDDSTINIVVVIKLLFLYEVYQPLNGPIN